MSAYWHYLGEALVSLRLVLRQTVCDAFGTTHPVGRELDLNLLDYCQATFSADEIENVFELARPYDAEFLEQELVQFLDHKNTLSELYVAEVHNYWLREGAQLLSRYPKIGFRLAILKHCIRFEYKRTLFCLWLAIYESEHSGRSLDAFQGLFLTALSHDLGLLEVDPRFTRMDHDPRASRDDIDGFYRHVEFGANFLRRQADVSNQILRSIVQHHEKMDGTGYPNGCSGNVLAEYGQHIHLYDTIYSIYTKQFEPLNKTLADIVPVIQINSMTHFGQVAIRLLEVLQKASRSTTAFFAVGDFDSVCAQAEAMANYVSRSIEIIQCFNTTAGYRHEDRALFVLQNSFIHIALAYYRLRVTYKQVELGDLMNGHSDAVELNRALEDNFLSLREIIFHINRFLYRLRLYQANTPPEGIRTAVDDAVDALQNLAIKFLP